MSSLISGTAATAAALIGLRWQRSASQPAEIEKNVERFRTSYLGLTRNQTELSLKRLRSSPPEWRSDDSFPLLARSEWLPDVPVPLHSSVLRLTPSEDGVREAVVPPKLRGLSPAGAIPYSQALIEKLGKNFTPGIIYRPLSMKFVSGTFYANFTTATYFEYLDTSEVLAYLSYIEEDRGPRARLGDPYDLTNRAASLGILTLTIIRELDGAATFMMHHRSSAVSLGTNLFHVVPAGEFAPSNKRLSAIRQDLVLWRNVAREYAEELSGDEDAQGDGGKQIDYRHSPPYAQMVAAEEAGALQFHILGIGLDPLTWKPEILTVACFDRHAFDNCFGRDFPGNAEGRILEGEVFERQTLDEYFSSNNIRPGARACLELAWKHRAYLGLSD